MPDKIIRFSVSLPADSGFIGRSCGNADCGRYFKVHLDSLRETMYCPYCGERFSKNELLTKDQEEHITEIGLEKAREYVFSEIDKWSRSMSRRFRGQKGVTWKHKPIRYRAKPISPRYQERQVDSELVCSECGFPFQVYGIFGYCPGCRSENLWIYDANFEIVRREISASPDPQRQLRHAYGDLVSTFEGFCSAKARSITTEPGNFQELFSTRKFFRKKLGVDIFERLGDGDLLVLRRVFQKRHVCEHNQGIISEQYARKMPEDAKLIGQQADLSLEELESGAALLRGVLDKLSQVLEP